MKDGMSKEFSIRHYGRSRAWKGFPMFGRLSRTGFRRINFDEARMH